MKKLFSLTALFMFTLGASAQDTTDCYLNTNFTYSIDGDYIYFTNTSTDEPVDANYDWWVSPLSSTDENPSFLISDLEDPTWACLTVYNADWSCSDSICMTIAFVEDSVIVIDSTACFLYASFSWAIDGDNIYFTNTSTGEPDGAIYDWWMGDSGSTDENPVFSLVGLDDSHEICFTVHNWDWSCWDSLCTTIYFDDSSGVVDSTAGLIANNRLDFNLYPNPASDNLTISFDNLTDSKQIFIYNALGELVRKESVGIGESQVIFDVSELTNGFYIITVMDASQQELGAQQKFIKN